MLRHFCVDHRKSAVILSLHLLINNGVCYNLCFLLDCPGLWMVETIHKVGTAKALNEGWGLRNVVDKAGNSTCEDKLKVLIQVNTGKKQGTRKHWCLLPPTSYTLSSLMSDSVYVCVYNADKLGCQPEEVCDIASYILEECKHLQLNGLMTTGSKAPTSSNITSSSPSTCSSSLDFAVSHATLVF